MNGVALDSLHTTHEELARQLKEKSFNWLQKSPQILPHQRMFTIMLEPSPGTKKTDASSTMRITFFVAAKVFLLWRWTTHEDVMQGRRQTVLLE